MARLAAADLFKKEVLSLLSTHWEKMARPAAATDSFKKEVVSLMNTLAKEVGCDELAIDVPLVMEPTQWPECCIYRVPKKLREVNKEAYTPKLISIGPLHHGENELCAMEILKLRYLREFCYRIKKGYDELASVIEANELKIRRCYEETFDISSEDFVKMVLLDSTFIIELFLKYAASDSSAIKNDYISSKPLLKKHIQQDLILLENQIPFFILDKLYRQSPMSEQISFLELAQNYLLPASERETIIDERRVKHFTDLKRYVYYPSIQQEPGKPIENLHNAKKLDEAGVIFKRAEKGSLLDIVFQKSNLLETFPCFTCSWLLHCVPFLERFQCLVNTQTFLKVPRLEVRDETECIFRNLMALEQCHYPNVAYICNYIVLLDFLINTREDVELLVDEGIIVNALGSNKAVATMVNRLRLEIVENNSFYQSLTQDLNAFYSKFWNRSMGYLRTIYFRDIWRGTATVVGVIVLVVTVLNFLRPFIFGKI
jgi:hypothetical protein